MHTGLIDIGRPLEGLAVALQNQYPAPRFSAAQGGIEAIEAGADDKVVVHSLIFTALTANALLILTNSFRGEIIS